MPRPPKPAIVVDTTNPMFRQYDIRIEMTGKFAAGIPKNPESLLSFLESRSPETPPEDATPLPELVKEIEGEVFDPTISKEASLTTTFKKDDEGLVYEARGVKAHLKECAQILGQGHFDLAAMKSRVANRINIEPEMIPITRDGERVTVPDGQEIRPITVMTMQGPRTAIKVVDFVDKITLAFSIVVLEDKVFQIDEKVLNALLSYGGRIKGLGQDRGIGWGRYRIRCITPTSVTD